MPQNRDCPLLPAALSVAAIVRRSVRRVATAGRAVPLSALVLVVLLAATAPAAWAADPDLAAEWHLDDQALGYTPDSSGNDNKGEVNGGARFLPGGRFSGALDLNVGLGHSAKIDVLDAPSLDRQRLTVMAWVKSSGSPGALKYVIAKGGNACTAASYALDTGDSGGLSFYVFDGTATHRSPDAGTQLWDGAWHAVAGTFDGATVRLFVDGAEVGSGVAAPVDIAFGLPTQRLNIGNYPNSAQCPAYDTVWPGLIDEARIYQRALSAAEIAYLQRGDAAAPSELPLPAPAPAPAPAPGPAPGPIPVAGSAAHVSAVRAVAPVVAGHSAVLSADIQGDVRRLDWDLNGDGATDVSCDGQHPTLRFRPPISSAARGRATGSAIRVSVRAVGPGETASSLTQSVSVAPAGPISGPARVTTRIADLVAARAPVYACGRASDLAAATGELTVKADTSQTRCLPRIIKAGTLNVEGCLEPIHRIQDIPAAERGIVLTLARTLRLPVAKGSALANLQRAVDLTDSYLAIGAVTVNGVELTPRGDARIVVYSQINQIVSSDADMSVGDILLEHQQNFSLDTTATPNGQIPLGDFARRPGGVGDLGAFDLKGDVHVVLDPAAAGAPAGAEITTQLQLPDFLTIGGGHGNVQVRLRVTADGQLVLEDLHIGPLDAEIGPLGVSGLQLDYTRATREWKGQGKLCVVIACLDAVERPGEAPPGGVVIRDGHLVRAFVNLDLPTPGIALFPGVFLTRIGAGIGLDPTRFLGGARVSALAVFQIDGTLVLALPSEAAPFRLTREESGGGFPDQFYGRAYPRFTMALGGEGFLKVPLIDGRIRLAGAYLLYEVPGYIAFGGDVGFDFFHIISLSGHANGEINVATGRFNLGGDIHACIADVICGGAIARISSVGVGGCVTASIFGESISVGGGVQYSPFAIKLWPFDGCKWSRFDEPNVFASRAHVAHAQASQAGGPLLVDIKHGDASRAIRFDGTGGAPRVRVTAPNGAVLDSPDTPGIRVSKGIRILRSEQLGSTVVGLVDPIAGAYTINPLPDSPAIAKVTEAQDPPDARVTASVRGHGARRTLVYDVLPRPDQRVTFVETGPDGNRPIATVTGGRGTLPFSPAPGGGRRHIVAQFQLDGNDAETKTVASFSPPSRHLGRPAHLRVHRHGRALRVSWTRVEGATRYEVITTLASGPQRRLSTRRVTTTIAAVTRGSGGRVTVRAVASMQQGSLRTARFRAVGPRAKTRLGPLPRPGALARR